MANDPTTDHYDGRRFFNPSGANGQPFRMVPRLLLTKRTPWPKSVPVDVRFPGAHRGPDAIRATFVGHATFLLQCPTGNILIDPVFSDRASPVQFAGPKRVRKPGVPLDQLPPISVVLLSHNHYDHCDVRTLRVLEERFSPTVVTAIGNERLLARIGMRRVEALDWWQSAAPLEFRVTATPAQHFSARALFDRNRALWCGFMLSCGARRIYFAGDSGYGNHFEAIRERLGSPDLALLPIGAYEPRWFMRDIHMNPDEAVRAHRDLGARQSVAMHFGTFQLTPEGIDEPVEALAAALAAHRVPVEIFHVLAPGASLDL